MRVLHRRKAVVDVYTITEARRPLSEDVRYRQRRYLLSMGIRTACVLIAVLLAGHVPTWGLLIPIVGAVLLPYVAVVFANGGREPENGGRPDRSGLDPADHKDISGHGPEIPS